jgi:hypothetical protein
MRIPRRSQKHAASQVLTGLPNSEFYCTVCRLSTVAFQALLGVREGSLRRRYRGAGRCLCSWGNTLFLAGMAVFPGRGATRDVGAMEDGLGKPSAGVAQCGKAASRRRVSGLVQCLRAWKGCSGAGARGRIRGGKAKAEPCPQHSVRRCVKGLQSPGAGERRQRSDHTHAVNRSHVTVHSERTTSSD